VTVTATIEGHSGAAQVTVVEAAVASVTVSPAETNVQAGSTIQLTAVLKDDQGNILTAARSCGRPRMRFGHPSPTRAS
jgi:hypothetical protein